ncbi:MAG: hypothetical protein WCT04_19450 [Planctomycetota bacterium]
MDTEIDKAVSKLREACGFQNSESATESFLDVLAEAVKRTKKERTKSHRKGLCWDCQAALGSNLTEILRASPVEDVKKGGAL